jgi:nicotinate-nucleotide adenylyltransferase
MSTRRIGLLGGTFDPIHRGHLDLAAAAQEALGLTQLYIIPANVPPHRARPIASSFHRFAMVSLVVAGRPDWMASDIELRHEAPSYTSTTLQRFSQRGYRASELYFLIGADAFADIEHWREYPRILERAHFAVVSRPGASVSDLSSRVAVLAARMVHVDRTFAPPASPSIFLIDAPTARVSSSAIRARIEAGEPLDGMVDARVEQHIAKHTLYRSVSADRRNRGGEEAAAAGRLHGQD